MTNDCACRIRVEAPTALASARPYRTPPRVRAPLRLQVLPSCGVVSPCGGARGAHGAREMGVGPVRLRHAEHLRAPSPPCVQALWGPQPTAQGSCTWPQ